jgi:hypothetical protein
MIPRNVENEKSLLDFVSPVCLATATNVVSVLQVETLMDLPLL